MNFSGGTTNVDASELYSALNGALTWNILTGADRNGATEFGPVIAPSLLAASSGNVVITGGGSGATITPATVSFTLEEKLSDIRAALLDSAAAFGISAADVSGIRLNLGSPGALPVNTVVILSADQFNIKSLDGDVTSPFVVRQSGSTYMAPGSNVDYFVAFPNVLGVPT